jgi:hypothetical protein
VKAKACAVTDSYEDEGFAKAVETLILPRVKAREALQQTETAR